MVTLGLDFHTYSVLILTLQHPEAGSNHVKLEFNFQVGNQKLNNEKFLAYINRLPAGPEREAHTLEYVRGMKQTSRFMKDSLGYMRKDCRAVGISDEDFKKKI